jgi:hypothetical protein
MVSSSPPNFFHPFFNVVLAYSITFFAYGSAEKNGFFAFGPIKLE